MLELAVLGSLKEQPLHGYELKKRLSDTLGSLWGISYGSLYPALRRLERDGDIEIVEATADASGPGSSMPATGSLDGDLAAARRRLVVRSSRRIRKAYRLTPSGEARFARLLLADDGGGDDERGFVLKLAFCRHLDPSARLQLLERRRAQLVDRLARQQRTTPGRSDRYTRSLFEHRAESTRRDLQWVETLISDERASQEPSVATEPDDSPAALIEGVTRQGATTQ